jgi:two-component system nitrate/nitrite response regulator NarL
MIRVFVCSAVRIYREGLAEALDARLGVTIVGTSGGRRDTLVRLRALAADIILLDMSTPDSIAILSEMPIWAPGARLVALGVSETDPAVLACAEAGVIGYVTREQELDDLVMALNAAARGEALCPPKTTALLIKRLSVLAGTRGSPSTGTAHLTRREHQILGLIGGGLSNKAIGQQLNIELPTVKNHVHNILEKLGVSDRHEAAKVAGGLTVS